MEEIKNSYYESFRKINFIERFERIRESFNDFDNRMTKLDNKEVKRIFNEQGYNVKVFSPGQDFYYEEFFGDFKLHFEITKKGGIIQNRIDVYFKGEVPEKLDTNFYFLYRVLIKNMNLEISTPICYSCIEDFEQILKEYLSIYEDFKQEFNGLLKEKGILSFLGVK